MGRHRGLVLHPPKRAAAVLAGVLAALLVPALALAHPLGNFTINHYAGIRVEPDAIRLDVVIDQAEIPTFQERIALDLDGDGSISDDEIEAGRLAECTKLVPSLDLRVGGVAQPLTLTDAGLQFPPGAGGLDTMRLVCGLVAPQPTPLADGARITFSDGSSKERIGWREIVAEGSGMTVVATSGVLRPTTLSSRLSSYPTDLLTRPLSDDAIALAVTVGGPTLTPFDIPDATPLPGAAGVPGASSSASPAPSATAVAQAGSGPAATVAPATVAGSVPGGVSAGELPSIFRTADLTPLVLLLSLGTAVVLGAGHALTPGHGKTLMAAYLVGTRGTPLHALGLGLSVTLSHTMGILALAALIVGAQGFLAPDVVVRTAPMVAAISIVLIGGWMLIGEIRRRRAVHALATTHDHDHEHEHEHAHESVAHDDPTGAHDHPHAGELEHPHADEHAHPHPHPHTDARADEHAHPHADEHAHPHPHAEASPTLTPGEHSHGGVRHTHLPPAGTTITWRNLFVLGLAGGLIPSTSALLILLGSIAAGRPAFGFILVVAFGLGMALVMGGIGLALVLARGRLDRADARSRLGRFSSVVPLVAALLVFGLGIYLTWQAVAGTPVL